MNLHAFDDFVMKAAYPETAPRIWHKKTDFEKLNVGASFFKTAALLYHVNFEKYGVRYGQTLLMSSLFLFCI